MPLLGPDDPLPHRPLRVTVNGTSGAGKSTLARRLGGLLDLPYTELDSLHHGPGWVPQPDFLERVESFSADERWVCEFQYDAARPVLADRADLLVWLDLPTPEVMRRLVLRTLRRRLRREELWHGNREAPLHTFFTDPEHVLRWAWATRRDAERRARALVGSHTELTVVRLRSAREVEQWITGPLASTPGDAGGRGQEGRR